MSGFLLCTQDILVYSDIGMVYFGICVDLENRYRLDSVLYIDKYTLQYCSGFLLATYETVYSAYLQCALLWCTQHIYSLFMYGISVHLNIYQGFLLVNDKSVLSNILVHTKENKVSNWLILLAVYSDNILV